MARTLRNHISATPKIIGRTRPIALTKVQHGEVAERHGDIRVVRAKRLFVDRQGALVKPLGRAIVALQPIELDEVVQRRANTRMVGVEFLF